MAAFSFFECAACGWHAETADTGACAVDGGPLLVRYNFGSNVPRPEASSHADIWRFAAALPAVEPVTLGEGATPLRQGRALTNMFVKDESANPGGSLLSRGAAVVAAMARRFGGGQIAVSSAVDAQLLAFYAAAAGIDSVPARSTDEVAWMQPWMIEGGKTAGFEVVEQLGWQFPDAVVCAGATTALAMTKAFAEMEALGWVSGPQPRVITARAVADATTTRTWLAEHGILLTRQGAAAVASVETLRASGELSRDARVVVIDPGKAYSCNWTTELSGVRRAPARKLPTSLPVGGIITPV